MVEGQLGDGAWVEVPKTFILMFATLQLDGWEYCIYDMQTMSCLKKGFASSEPDAHDRAEQWMVESGIVSLPARLDWKVL